MEYLRIPNWEDYQHYKDRAPPWIKLHNALLDDYEFCSLPDAAKFQVICLWLLASRLNNIIPADPDWIANRIGANTPVDLAVLLEAGFIEPVPAEHVATQTEQVATQDKKGAGAMSKTAPAWGNRHIPKAIKELVHERDNGTCQTCGSTENIEFDHIVPISKGGVSIDSNLQLLCRSCNRRKRAKPAEQVATQDAGADSGLRSLEGEGEGEGEGEREKKEKSPPKKKSASKAKSKHKNPEGFEKVWLLKPSRSGGNPKRSAQSAWNARMEEKHDPEEISAGVIRYTNWLRAKGSIGTEYVMQMATFLGPDLHFQEKWQETAVKSEYLDM